MSDQQANEPAFPRNINHDEHGLTKRELITAIILAGVVANQDTGGNYSEAMVGEAIATAEELLKRLP